MNALATYIQSQNLTGTPAEIVAALDADVTLREDHTYVSYAGLAKMFGYKTISTIDETLKQVPGMDWVRSRLSSVGLDFADPETRKGLSDLQAGGALSAEMVTALLAIGVTPGKRYQKAGLESLPTEEQAATALAQIAFVAWAELAQQTLQAGINGEQTDIAAMKQQIAELK